jgi:hypothetical protein
MMEEPGSVVSGKGHKVRVKWERNSGAVYIVNGLRNEDTGIRVKSAAEALNVAREYVKDR